MNLPHGFIQNIQNVFGEKGKMLLNNLPDYIREASTRWGLRDVQPVSNLSFNYVAFAKRGNEDVVLKIGIPHDELISEMTALKLFNGDGACQLLEHDEERGFLLLERLKPGMMLSELEDDDERTHIAAEVMQKIWREIPAAENSDVNNKFIQLSDWFDGLKKIRPHFGGGTGPFPKELLERVKSFLPELFFAGADGHPLLLLHGDFHHFNILSSERGWLVIDPKGVIGPAGYEVGPLMMNPLNSISDSNRPALSAVEGFKVRAKRRVSILAERLGWEREKIINWATAHAVISAWWSIEDGAGEEDTSWEYSMWCAKIFSELK